MELPPFPEPRQGRWRRLISSIGKYVLEGLDAAGRLRYGYGRGIPPDMFTYSRPMDTEPDVVADFREQLKVEDVIGEMEKRHRNRDEGAS